MKKLLMMAAIAALSSSAWAANTYTWTIKITNLESGYELPSDLTAYLIDTTQPLVGSPTGYNTFMTITYQDAGTPVILDHSDADGYYAYFTTTFQTVDGNPIDDSKDSIMTVLVSESMDKYQAILTKFSATSGNSTLGATAKYEPIHIPEPTSGMLVLFGMVGLMLKRKRA